MLMGMLLPIIDLGHSDILCGMYTLAKFTLPMYPDGYKIYIIYYTMYVQYIAFGLMAFYNSILFNMPNN